MKSFYESFTPFYYTRFTTMCFTCTIVISSTFFAISHKGLRTLSSFYYVTKFRYEGNYQYNIQSGNISLFFFCTIIVDRIPSIFNYWNSRQGTKIQPLLFSRRKVLTRCLWISCGNGLEASKTHSSEIGSYEIIALRHSSPFLLTWKVHRKYFLHLVITRKNNKLSFWRFILSFSRCFGTEAFIFE